MRNIWILFSVAVVVLLGVMLLRPGIETGDGEENQVARDDRRDAAPEAPVDEVPDDEATAEDSERDTESANGETAGDVEPEEPEERASGGLGEIGQEFHESEDYFSFVEAHAEDGRAGDGEAQYYVYRALSDCQLALERFDHVPERHELEERMDPGMDPRIHDMMSDQIERCDGFFEEGMDEYGEAQEWLNGAALDGYPAAVVMKNIDEFRQHEAGRESNFNEAQVINALRSRNPEALQHASQFAALQGVPETDEAAWLLMSCDYGQDCSADSDWVQALCVEHGCPPQTEHAEDALAIFLGPGQVELAKARRQELEQAMDQGDFDALFGR